MSADLRLDDLMNSEFQDSSAAKAEKSASGISRRLKTILIVIVSLGALGGSFIAYLIITNPGRPEVDKSGATLDVTVNENGDKQNQKDLLAQKLNDPNIIANYFNDHPPEEADHPLDPAVKVAQLGLERGRQTIKDYTAVLHKQERIGGKLAPKEIVKLKIRYDSIASGMEQSPMSVYIKFLEPKDKAGREVIWRKGHNRGKLTVHGYMFGRGFQMNLPPDGYLAMQGNRYPMTEIGFETLVLRMIEKGIRDKKYGECEVNINRTANINQRPCTLIEIIHPQERDHFEFHIAKIFIDDELNIPLRYAAYSWPKEEGGKPVLEEQYTFTDVELNVGLTDQDFDTKNPEYNFN